MGHYIFFKHRQWGQARDQLNWSCLIDFVLQGSFFKSLFYFLILVLLTFTDIKHVIVHRYCNCPGEWVILIRQD